MERGSSPGLSWECGVGRGDFESCGRNLSRVVLQASRKAGTRGKATTKQAQRGSSNVFSMFEQAQIQEFKEVSAPRCPHLLGAPLLCGLGFLVLVL